MKTNIDITGTWEIESAYIEIDGEKISTVDPSRKMIKIFSDRTFTFFSRDINRENFKGHTPTNEEIVRAYNSLDAGFGEYKLEGNKYTETIEYCTHPNYEGKTITFDISINNNKLFQQGRYPLVDLGLGDKDAYIIETYIRKLGWS